MGSQSINDFNNDFLTIKSNRSSINDVKSTHNRGRDVEKSYQTCGKSRQKSGKLSQNCAKLSPRIAEAKADTLINVFNAPQCREYFIKCVYHLSADFIAKAIDYSTRPGIMSPVKYFNAMTKAELLKQGL